MRRVFTQAWRDRAGDELRVAYRMAADGPDVVSVVRAQGEPVVLHDEDWGDLLVDLATGHDEARR